MLNGRILRDGEPLWRQDDTDLAVALLEYEAERCPGCGHSRAESMDPAHEFDWRVEPARCHACATRERAARSASADETWSDAGIQWVVTRRWVPGG